MSKIRDIRQILGVEPADYWGPAAQAALDKLIKAGSDPVSGGVVEMQWPLEANAGSFYGLSNGTPTWENVNLTTFPAPYELFMDGTKIAKVRCHKLVAGSLERILHRILDHYGSQSAIHAVGLDQYDGCYNYRPVRGGGRLSMHAYGAAIDFDSSHNPLGASHGRMPADVVKIFKTEGWRWGGDYRGRKDWMHFEACR